MTESLVLKNRSFASEQSRVLFQSRVDRHRLCESPDFKGAFRPISVRSATGKPGGLS